MPSKKTPMIGNGKGRRRAALSIALRQGVRRSWRSWASLLTSALLVALAGVVVVSGRVSATNKTPPNILLIVMDDIGIDQWRIFRLWRRNPRGYTKYQSNRTGWDQIP
jgi:hypothetical protein